MDVRTPIFRIVLCLFALGALVLASGSLSGCHREITRPNDVGTYSEATIALSKIPTSQLKHCDTTLSERQNGVGELLADYNELAGKGGACAIEHNGLVDYLLDTMRKLGIAPGVPLDAPVTKQ